LLLPLIERNSMDINKSHIDHKLQFERLEEDIEEMVFLKKDIIAALEMIDPSENGDRSDRSDRRDRREYKERRKGGDRRESKED